MSYGSSGLLEFHIGITKLKMRIIIFRINLEGISIFNHCFLQPVLFNIFPGFGQMLY